MENIRLENSLSRRNFLKGVAAGAAALGIAAAAPSIAPLQKAFADQSATAGELADGTYALTAKVYVPYEVHGQVLAGDDAHLTDPSDPNKLQGFPTNPPSMNATMVISGGTYSVTVPILNPAFEWTTYVNLIGANGMDYTDCVTHEMVEADYHETFGSEPEERIGSITVTLDSTDVADFTFTGCREYASVFAIKDWKEWDISLSIDFSSAVAQ